MLFSDASGRKVVSTTTAETVGKVGDYVVDPQGPAVAAIKVKKSDGDTLRWSDIVAFGADAVTVESAEKITKDVDDDLAPLLEKRNHLHKKMVLTTTGDEIGAVKDIDFDPSTGKISTLVLNNGEVAAGRLIGVGSYAVIVEAETSPATGGPSAAAPASDASVSSAPAAEPSPSVPSTAPLQPPIDETSLNLSPSPGITLDPPDLSQAQRASYPPAE